MAAGRRSAPGRRRLLLLLLAAMIVVLTASFGRLRLSYGLASARSELDNGRADAALAALERHAARGADDPEWQYLRARALRRADFLTEAEQQLAQAKRSGWNAEDIRREELLLEARRGRIKKVELQLVELLESGVSDQVAEEIYEAMTQGYWASYFVEDALRCLEFWMEWQPKNLVPRLWIADLFERSERESAAAIEYRNVLALDPQNTEALTKLGDLLIRKLELDEAEEIFARCSVADPEMPAALLGLADCRRRRGANEEVKELLYDALTLDLSPLQEGQALGTLGTLALEDREYEQAVQLLQESASLDPNEPATYVSLGAALNAIGQDELAAKARQQGRDMSDRKSRLLQVTRKAISDPANADLRCEAGTILMEQGFWPEGANWIKTAIAIDPDHRASHEGLAKYYEHIGDLQQAKQHRALAAPAAEEPAAAKSENG